MPKVKEAKLFDTVLTYRPEADAVLQQRRQAIAQGRRLADIAPPEACEIAIIIAYRACAEERQDLPFLYARMLTWLLCSVNESTVPLDIWCRSLREAWLTLTAVVESA